MSKAPGQSLWKKLQTIPRVINTLWFKATAEEKVSSSSKVWSKYLSHFIDSEQILPTESIRNLTVLRGEFAMSKPHSWAEVDVFLHGR